MFSPQNHSLQSSPCSDCVGLRRGSEDYHLQGAGRFPTLHGCVGWLETGMEIAERSHHSGFIPRYGCTSTLLDDLMHLAIRCSRVSVKGKRWSIDRQRQNWVKELTPDGAVDF
jgi:hypothetical protein